MNNTSEVQDQIQQANLAVLLLSDIFMQASNITTAAIKHSAINTPANPNCIHQISLFVINKVVVDDCLLSLSTRHHT